MEKVAAALLPRGIHDSEDQSGPARTSRCLGVSSGVTRTIDMFEEN